VSKENIFPSIKTEVHWDRYIQYYSNHVTLLVCPVINGQWLLVVMWRVLHLTINLNWISFARWSSLWKNICLTSN